MGWTAKHIQNEFKKMKLELSELETFFRFEDLCLALGYTENQFNNYTNQYSDSKWFTDELEVIKSIMISKIIKYGINHPQSANFVQSILKQFWNIGDGIIEQIDSSKVEVIRTIINKHEV